MSNILITGTKGSLGSYLLKSFPGATGLTRENSKDLLNFPENQLHKYDLIIHCAFNTTNKISNHKEYLEDNILLTQKLCNLSCNRFVYISSVDVYNKSQEIYGMFKLFSESIVKDKCKNYTILRPSAMVGPDLKPNSVIKLINNKNTTLTLSKKSTFNIINQQDLLNFIKKLYTCSDDDKSKFNGTINFISKDNVSLEEINNRLDCNGNFGDYIYTTPSLDNKKIITLYPEMNKSSWDVIKEII